MSNLAACAPKIDLLTKSKFFLQKSITTQKAHFTDFYFALCLHKKINLKKFESVAARAVFVSKQPLFD
jgi:hypothetical protein